MDRHPLPADATLSSTTTLKKRGYEHQTDGKLRDRMMLANQFTDQENSPIIETRTATLAKRRDIVKRKRSCFNCTGFGHTASKCRSRGCRKCGGRHYTSLCDGIALDSARGGIQQPEMGKRAVETSTTLHATVMATVNGIPARIMVDSGASSSYICTNLVT